MPSREIGVEAAAVGHEQGRRSLPVGPGAWAMRVFRIASSGGLGQHRHDAGLMLFRQAEPEVDPKLAPPPRRAGKTPIPVPVERRTISPTVQALVMPW